MRCRVCYTLTIPWLDLGEQPLANGLLKPGDPPPTKYPLVVHRCPYCGMSQLSQVVPPGTLYKDYVYESGVAAGFKAHCLDLAQQLAEAGYKGPLLDIASNDGTLLTTFASEGWPVLGVEPCARLAKKAMEEGHLTLTGYFPKATESLPDGQVKVITSLNVLGHVDDVHGFAAEVVRLLAPDGVWVIEVPYIGALLRDAEFDTIYHEHLSYWSLKGLLELGRAHGLSPQLGRVTEVHGGSLSMVLGRGPQQCNTGDEEGPLLQATTYAWFKQRMWTRIQHFWSQFDRSKRWVGYGAAAKGTVFACVAGLGPNDLQIVVDETPAKQGYLTPYGVPIVGSLDWSQVDGVVIFPWNWYDEIAAKIPPEVEKVSTA